MKVVIQHPDLDPRLAEELIRFVALADALDGHLRDLLVVVEQKTSEEKPWQGRAYNYIPDDYRSLADSERFCAVLRLDKSATYPVSNVVKIPVWKKVPTPISIDPLHLENENRFRFLGEQLQQLAGFRSMPYGGFRSPLIVCNDWKELLVILAAHEFHHVKGWKEGTSQAEYICEVFAAKTLNEYRDEYGA